MSRITFFSALSVHAVYEGYRLYIIFLFFFVSVIMVYICTETKSFMHKMLSRQLSLPPKQNTNPIMTIIITENKREKTLEGHDSSLPADSVEQLTDDLIQLCVLTCRITPGYCMLYALHQLQPRAHILQFAVWQQVPQEKLDSSDVIGGEAAVKLQ